MPRNKNEEICQTHKKAKSYISQSGDVFKKEINYLEKSVKEKQDLVNGMTMKYENKKFKVNLNLFLFVYFLV